MSGYFRGANAIIIGGSDLSHYCSPKCPNSSCASPSRRAHENISRSSFGVHGNYRWKIHTYMGSLYETFLRSHIIWTDRLKRAKKKQSDTKYSLFRVTLHLRHKNIIYGINKEGSMLSQSDIRTFPHWSSVGTGHRWSSNVLFRYCLPTKIQPFSLLNGNERQRLVTAKTRLWITRKGTIHRCSGRQI